MKRVLITGTSSGIGRATAEHLSAEGYEVVATARKPETLAGLRVAERLPLDVQDAASVEALFEATGPVDVLVNNAGIALRGPVESVSIDAAQQVFDVNVMGLLRMVGAYAPSMREKGAGTIVNVSSVTGRAVLPLAGVYGASKAAVDAVTEALRIELGHFGVNVAVVVPGLVATGAFESSPVFASDDAGYLSLLQQMSRPSSSTPVEEVTRAIAEIIRTAEHAPLRTPVGESAHRLLSARASMDDSTFAETLKAVLSLDW